MKVCVISKSNIHYWPVFKCTELKANREYTISFANNMMLTSMRKGAVGNSASGSRRRLQAPGSNTTPCDHCRERQTVCRGGRPCRACTRSRKWCTFVKPPPRGRSCLRCSRLRKGCGREKPICRNCSHSMKDCVWPDESLGKQESGYLSRFKTEYKLISPDKDFKLPKSEYCDSVFESSRKWTSMQSKCFRIPSTHSATLRSSWVLSAFPNL